MRGSADLNLEAGSAAAEVDERLPAAVGRGAPRSLTRAVFEALRADILACRLAPGTKLRIAQLAQHYQVSLSAVREGLSRLAAEGWVQAIEQRGFRVADMSVADLEDLTVARGEVGALVLRLSIERGDAVWEAQVRQAYEALLRSTPPPHQSRSHSDAWRSAHWAFHLALVSGCGSARLLGFYTTLHEQAERYRIMSGIADDTRQRDVEDEHRRLVDAVLCRDSAAATDMLRQHFGLTASILRSTASGEAVLGD